MDKILVLAEKPSVGRDLARVLTGLANPALAEALAKLKKRDD